MFENFKQAMAKILPSGSASTEAPVTAGMAEAAEATEQPPLVSLEINGGNCRLRGVRGIQETMAHTPEGGVEEPEIMHAAASVLAVACMNILLNIKDDLTLRQALPEAAEHLGYGYAFGDLIATSMEQHNHGQENQ